MPTPAEAVPLARSDPASTLPLVLLPGTLCDERVFAPMLACLQSHIPGLHSHVFKTDRYSTMAELVEGILRHAPEHFALLGFSLGGIAALPIAAAAPERVRGLALLDSTALPVPEAQVADRRAQIAQASHLGLRTYLDQHLWPQYITAAHPSNTALREQLHQMAASLGLEALHRQTELALTRPDARPLLPSLTMPAFVLAREEDRRCPPDVQHALAAALPNAVLAIVPGAGHFALMEKPDTVAAHVAAWFHSLARP